MIARIWRGQATAANAGAYQLHVRKDVFPKLKHITGHRGAYLLRRAVDNRVEFLAVTLWESIEAIRQFSGNNVTTAVVEPEARAVLAEFDAFATHYEVAYGSGAPDVALPLA
jgi:heme-degrading monooxygenase HmoA